MFFVIPTGTDAPIYHWPFATAGVIVFHFVVLVLQNFFPEVAERLILHFGTINPVTWLTAMCMHSGVLHWLGNSIGIALFGWIVEGKIGWWRFLLVYFASGTIGCGLAQLTMIFADSGGALGASGALFGLIAIAMIWAPENEVRMFYFVLFFFYPYIGSFQITISTLGFVEIGIEFLTAAYDNFQMSSAILHLLGAFPGALIGYLMVKRRMVDCEGYDLISLMNGKRGQRVLTVSDEKANDERNKQIRDEAKEQKLAALNKIEAYIQAGHYEMALNRFSILRRTDRKLVLTEPQLAKIIQAFDADDSMKLKSVPLLQEYLDHYDRHQIHFALMLARNHLLLEERPRRALKVLQTLRGKELNLKQTDFVRKLVVKAQHMIDDGILEVDE